MPRIPKYRRQNSSTGQVRAFVEVNGQRHYLGEFDTHESRQAYDRIIAEYLTHDRVLAPIGHVHTVKDLCDAYWQYVSKPGQYRKPVNFKPMIELVTGLFGDCPVDSIRPADFETIQQTLVRDPMPRTYCGSNQRSRKYVNKQMNRVRRMFKWGKHRGFVPPEVHALICDFENLRPGKTTALDHDSIRPVDDEQVDAIKSFVCRQVWAMIELQRLSGARPGEIVALRLIDIDMSDPDLWTYRPESHKTKYRGKDRIIYFGPKSQMVLRPFLLRPVHAYLFSPKEAAEERRKVLRESRKTPVQPSQANRRKDKPAKTPGDRYTTNSYTAAVVRAQRRAYRSTSGASEPRSTGPKMHWTTNQLRHSYATAVSHKYGLEPAAVLLGHSKVETTQIYAEKNHAIARSIAMEIG